MANILHARLISVIRARLDRLRDGLLIFFAGVVFFGTAGAFDSSTEPFVALRPVLALASLIAVPGLAPTTSFLVIVGKRCGACGAGREDHIVLVVGWLVAWRVA